jgi:hypothetical protein
MPVKNCFVIIGYGKKPSYIDGKVRMLDLDETYSILIKPVFDEMGITCYRAIDKNINGSIDEQMLKEIKNADMALADISTLNANVMWELGVRHALKPHYTVMICEKEQMSKIPFDINSFVIHQYTHSEEGIPYKEVDRFRKYLKESIQKIIDQDPPVHDSPVFTSLKELLQASSPRAITDAADAVPAVDDTESFATILQNAETAKKEKKYDTALNHLKKARAMAEKNMTLKDNLAFIISGQALCTYKSEQPNKLEALVNAKIILDELKPSMSQDTEVLGLNGAINKQLFELTSNKAYLDNAITSYEKGFQLKQDYYNGINAAYMLYLKASLLKKEGNEEWEDVKLQADYVRNTVLKVANAAEAAESFAAANDAVWVLYTIAEAYNYKRNEAKMKEYEAKADAMAAAQNDSFAPDSYQKQKARITALFAAME